jgi:DNA adenine methylase
MASSAASKLEVVAAQPFFKAAGGKRQLLPELRKHIPPRFGTYFEPFVGGGALFFDLHNHGRITTAYLNDANPYMVSAYRALKVDPDGLIARLRMLADRHRKAGETHYYNLRKAMPALAELSPYACDWVEAGATFLFLNRTGFNGLWRVNSSGKYNVPFGRYANPTICDEEGLRVARAAVKLATVSCADFESFLEVRKPARGDFVYFDPPYWPVGGYADFVNYTKEGFGPEHQEQLRDVAFRLKKKGVHVLLSNADLEPVRNLYANGFEMRRVEARRAINSKTSKRGNVGELLIW